MKHIVSYSGGLGSFLSAKRVVEQNGAENTLLLFADTMMEDGDLYRFLDDTVQYLGAEFVKISDGRNPWQVFHDKRFIGNSRVDPCSRILKRELIREWLDSNYPPETCILYLGIDWTEINRLVTARERYKPYTVKAPLCVKPYLWPKQKLAELESIGIELPRLYQLGFPHNNCGGFCVKAGQAQFKMLLEKLPERYAWHEKQESDMMEYLGKKRTILRIQRDGKKIAVSLREFRQHIEEGLPIDELDYGGCGCAID